MTFGSKGWHGTQRLPVQSTGATASASDQAILYQRPKSATTVRHRQLSQHRHKSTGGTGRQVALDEYRAYLSRGLPAVITTTCRRPRRTSYCSFFVLFYLRNAHIGNRQWPRVTFHTLIQCMLVINNKITIQSRSVNPTSSFPNLRPA